MTDGSKRRYRVWTARERQLIRDHYGPLSRVPWPYERIARAVGDGVTVADVQQAARRYGMVWRFKRTNCQRVSPALLMRLYLRGRSDGAIAAALDWDRNAVQRWRTSKGLPPNKGPGGKVVAHGKEGA